MIQTSVILLFLLYSTFVFGADISFVITNLNNNRGEVVLMLFADTEKKSFIQKLKKEKPICSKKTKIEKDRVTILCSGISPSTYAAFAFHDENENGAVDHRWYGPPKEYIGFSGNTKPFFGPPNFVEAAFIVGIKNLNLTIQLEAF